ncbi:hypothetical protein GCM10010260_39620 [Streptomyces filipinensis]|uniref:Uncharacterized protein n=1 Tax=Streptomyces filipinensis TaxID=66887 RepID=A0A918IBR2_9ACTN|nr:hypothetical protein GCM10010260_39620 [Streptomyces filipinensis]
MTEDKSPQVNVISVDSWAGGVTAPRCPRRPGRPAKCVVAEAGDGAEPADAQARENRAPVVYDTGCGPEPPGPGTTTCTGPYIRLT